MLAIILLTRFFSNIVSNYKKNIVFNCYKSVVVTLVHPEVNPHPVVLESEDAQEGGELCYQIKQTIKTHKAFILVRSNS